MKHDYRGLDNNHYAVQREGFSGVALFPDSLSGCMDALRVVFLFMHKDIYAFRGEKKSKRTRGREWVAAKRLCKARAVHYRRSSIKVSSTFTTLQAVISEHAWQQVLHHTVAAWHRRLFSWLIPPASLLLTCCIVKQLWDKALLNYLLLTACVDM